MCENMPGRRDVPFMLSEDMKRELAEAHPRVLTLEDQTLTVDLGGLGEYMVEIHVLPMGDF
jgi:hypothetical protein